MAKADETNAQTANVEDTSAPIEQKERDGRRKFLGQALVAASAVALVRRWDTLLRVVKSAPQDKLVCPPPSPAFIPVNEITSRANKLKAVLSVVSAKDRVVAGTSRPLALRYYSGYNPDDGNQKWPLTKNAGPGPTFRCELGDSVQITFLNRVNLTDFMGTGLYSAEAGTSSSLCDEVNAGNWYPANDKYPNCFHASSAANVHFHGTHVTPSTTGDNVLVSIWPDPRMTDTDVQTIRQWFKSIFDKGEAVPDWNALPKAWRDDQMGIEPFPKNPKDRKGKIAAYDDAAVYQGQRGTLPENLRLWPANAKKITGKTWPQYYVGSYPICFRIPKWNGKPDSMGQAPGTHWYHSHKHGSTTINLFNGLEGALIIEDNSSTGYDGMLKGYYSKQGQKLDQFVLVLQQLTDTLNMMVTNRPGPPPVTVNGQLTPTITMRPGQIQLWRLINGSVQAFINAQFNPVQQKTLTTSLTSLSVSYRQTAQDGVQFAWENYSAEQNDNNPPFKLAPGNRIDLLVQAPSAPGCYVVQDSRFGPLLFMNVTGPGVSMNFPGTDASGDIKIQTDYPPLPGFLADIDPAKVKPHAQPIEYGYRQDPAPSPSPGQNFNQQTLNQFLIDGKQFSGGVDQLMKLGDAEEWTIKNMDTQFKTTHPFHIHINPFQVIEVFDPATMTEPLKLQPPYVWWDVFPIPAPSNVYPDGKPRLDANGKQTFVAGHFKMRTRFVDFTGVYVQHCHILAHEDRGMMQLVQVCKEPGSAQCMNEAGVEHH